MLDLQTICTCRLALARAIVADRDAGLDCTRQLVAFYRLRLEMDALTADEAEPVPPPVLRVPTVADRAQWERGL